jgi:L-fucose mutarotase
MKVTRQILLLLFSFLASEVYAGLLKGLDPLLTADVLHVLRSAGHGDVIAIVDCNFPAVEVATHTVTGKSIQLAGTTAPDVVKAIASVCPVDLFVDEPLHYMAPSPGLEMPPLGVEVVDLGQKAMGEFCGGATFEPVDRMAFYEKARTAFAIIQTGERRPYGNFLIQKGVVGPDGNDLSP